MNKKLFVMMTVASLIFGACADVDETDEADVDVQQVKAPSQEETEALETVEAYLEMSGRSRGYLQEILEANGYSEAAIQYALDTVDTDWQANALDELERSDDVGMKLVPERMHNFLLEAGYTEAEAEYAVENYDE